MRKVFLAILFMLIPAIGFGKALNEDIEIVKIKAEIAKMFAFDQALRFALTLDLPKKGIQIKKY